MTSAGFRVAFALSMGVLGSCAESKSAVTQADTPPLLREPSVQFGMKPERYQVHSPLEPHIVQYLRDWNMHKPGPDQLLVRAVTEQEIRLTKLALLPKLGRQGLQPEHAEIYVQSYRPWERPGSSVTMLGQEVSGRIEVGQAGSEKHFYDFEVDAKGVFHLVGGFNYDATLAQRFAECTEDIHFTVKRVPKQCSSFESDFEVRIFDRSKCSREAIEQGLVSEAGKLLDCSGQVTFRESTPVFN